MPPLPTNLLRRKERQEFYCGEYYSFSLNSLKILKIIRRTQRVRRLPNPFFQPITASTLDLAITVSASAIKRACFFQVLHSSHLGSLRSPADLGVKPVFPILNIGLRGPPDLALSSPQVEHVSTTGLGSLSISPPIDWFFVIILSAKSFQIIIDQNYIFVNIYLI